MNAEKPETCSPTGAAGAPDFHEFFFDPLARRQMESTADWLRGLTATAPEQDASPQEATPRQPTPDPCARASLLAAALHGQHYHRDQAERLRRAGRQLAEVLDTMSCGLALAEAEVERLRRMLDTLVHCLHARDRAKLLLHERLADAVLLIDRQKGEIERLHADNLVLAETVARRQRQDAERGSA